MTDNYDDARARADQAYGIATEEQIPLVLAQMSTTYAILALVDAVRETTPKHFEATLETFGEHGLTPPLPIGAYAPGLIKNITKRYGDVIREGEVIGKAGSTSEVDTKIPKVTTDTVRECAVDTDARLADGDAAFDQWLDAERRSASNETAKAIRDEVQSKDLPAGVWWRTWVIDIAAAHIEPCPTCQGPMSRETVDMVCETCGHDYTTDSA